MVEGTEIAMMRGLRIGRGVIRGVAAHRPGDGEVLVGAGVREGSRRGRHMEVEVEVEGGDAVRVIRAMDRGVAVGREGGGRASSQLVREG